MKKITIFLFAAGLLSSLAFTSCKDACYTCTYMGSSVTNVCDDQIYDKDYYEKLGYECTEE